MTAGTPSAFSTAVAPGVPGSTPGGKTTYDAVVVGKLRQLWELSGYLCSNRCSGACPAFLQALERCRELVLEPEVKLVRISPATMDRKLAPYRAAASGRGLTTTKLGTLLEHAPLPTETRLN